MKIFRVTINYGELRSEGYPNFSNKRYEIMLGAKLEEGESARTVKERLTELAKREVKYFFGDNVDQTELDLPY